VSTITGPSLLDTVSSVSSSDGNCVARRIVYGTPLALTTPSVAIFIR
jgi:hypothetical protein